jgi:hypothetical protein
MNSNDFFVDVLPGIVISLLFLALAVYLLYAAIKKDPIYDPDSVANFIASFPFWDKSLTRIIFFIFGAGYCILFICWSVILLLKHLKTIQG